MCTRELLSLSTAVLDADSNLIPGAKGLVVNIELAPPDSDSISRYSISAKHAVLRWEHYSIERITALVSQFTNLLARLQSQPADQPTQTSNEHVCFHTVLLVLQLLILSLFYFFVGFTSQLRYFY